MTRERRMKGNEERGGKQQQEKQKKKKGRATKTHKLHECGAGPINKKRKKEKKEEGKEGKRKLCKNMMIKISKHSPYIVCSALTRKKWRRSACGNCEIIQE